MPLTTCVHNPTRRHAKRTSRKNPRRLGHNLVRHARAVFEELVVWFAGNVLMEEYSDSASDDRASWPGPLQPVGATRSCGRHERVCRAASGQASDNPTSGPRQESHPRGVSRQSGRVFSDHIAQPTSRDRPRLHPSSIITPASSSIGSGIWFSSASVFRRAEPPGTFGHKAPSRRGSTCRLGLPWSDRQPSFDSR
jgi:hypothetical protein